MLPKFTVKESFVLEIVCKATYGEDDQGIHTALISHGLKSKGAFGLPGLADAAHTRELWHCLGAQSPVAASPCFSRQCDVGMFIDGMGRWLWEHFQATSLATWVSSSRTGADQFSLGEIKKSPRLLRMGMRDQTDDTVTLCAEDHPKREAREEACEGRTSQSCG
ncbi:hypothetical protein BaRGS_00014749 [Batillaria attramentaria]|uniref:Uncharacterized protein n=1 Tax=Batillaria attramentaria TaxID=370345 RepID=A0ABD0L3F4_9CAEN